jgi:hypothetical protein
MGRNPSAPGGRSWNGAVPPDCPQCINKVNSIPIHTQRSTKENWTAERKNSESSFKCHSIRLYNFGSEENIVLRLRASGGIFLIIRNIGLYHFIKIF